MTLNEINALIASGENESKYLDFKAGGALEKKANDTFKNELSKDISSFANSAGGRILYGVAERPLRLDPIDPRVFSAERLEQLIDDNIAPRIPGIRVHVIPVEGEKVLYEVEKPKGKTAHQAADGKYYRRGERTTHHMEDHEIRDVIARSSGIETNLLLVPDLTRCHSKNGGSEKWRPGRHFQVHVTNQGDKVSNWCVAEVSASAHAVRSPDSTRIVQKGNEVLEVFTFSNATKTTEGDEIIAPGYPIPLLPHRALNLGWITLHEGDYYEPKQHHGVMIRYPAPPDSIYWTVYCDEGTPSSGQYSLKELAQRYDNALESFNAGS
jgi:Putative DNA-binding domain